jgi:DNA-binding transcriptional MocR family regulator
MSLSYRRSLVQLARKYDALIITDDVYDFLQWPTTSPQSLTRAILPRLVDIDRAMEPVPGQEDFGNAVSNGSFSKIAGPGVRTGWAEATPKLVYGLSQCGSSRSGGAPSQLTATFMDSLLRSGDLGEHIEKVLQPAYKRRYEIMMSAIRKELVVPLGVKVEEGKIEGKDVFGGYFIWLELPVDAEVVSERCRETENLIVAPGKLFEVQGDGSIKFENSVRLCFSWEEEADLEEAVIRLARVVKDVIDGKGTKAVAKVSKRDLEEFGLEDWITESTW